MYKFLFWWHNKNWRFWCDNVLINKIFYENVLFYKISYENLIAAKTLRIRFNKTDGFVRIYDGTRDLVLFGSEKYDLI